MRSQILSAPGLQACWFSSSAHPQSINFRHHFDEFADVHRVPLGAKQDSAQTRKSLISWHVALIYDYEHDHGHESGGNQAMARIAENCRARNTSPSERLETSFLSFGELMLYT